MEIIKVELTPNMVEQAIKDEKNMVAQKGGHHDDFTERGEGEDDKIGSLAQQAVIKQFNIWDFIPEASPYFDSRIRRDLFDFRWRGVKVDVKGSPLGEGFDFVPPNSRLLVANHKKEVTAKCNAFCFVKVSIDLMAAFIVGMIDYDEFWSLDQTSEKYKMNVTRPAHFAFAYQLRPFRDFVFGTERR